MSSQSDEMKEPAVLTEHRGPILIITLNRPDAMNAINGALSDGVGDPIETRGGDTGLVAGDTTGSGRDC